MVTGVMDSISATLLSAPRCTCGSAAAQAPAATEISYPQSAAHVPYFHDGMDRNAGAIADSSQSVPGRRVFDLGTLSNAVEPEQSENSRFSMNRLIAIHGGTLNARNCAGFPTAYGSFISKMDPPTGDLRYCTSPE